MLDASNVLVVLDQLDRTGLVVWLDGGWGVDALLGRHSRPHQDLNLVIARDDCAAAEAALAGMGFQHDLAAVPGWPAQLLLGDADGRRVDLHVVVFDGHGNGWQELGGGAWGGYPAEGLTGLGMVEGRQVRCLTPQPQGWSSPRLRWTPPTTTTWGCSPSGSGWRCHRASSLRRATTGQTVRRIRPEAAAD